MFWISNALRLVQGILCLVVTVLIIVKSSDVIDLFKDFAALSLISLVDNAAFALSETGVLGTKFQQSTRKVNQLKITASCKTRVPMGVGVLFFLILAGLSIFSVSQGVGSF